MSTPNNTDLLLVERGGSQYKVPYSDLNNKLDTDVFLVERNGVQYKVLGEFIGGSSVGVVTAAPVLTATNDSKVPAVITVTNATVENATLTGNIWLKDGVAIAAATGPSYSATDGGVYTIKQTWTDDLGNTFQVEAQHEILNPRYVDEVFSTAVYTGNGSSSNTVPSGLDFTDGDWLAWIKLRNGNDSSHLADSTQKTGTNYDSLASDRTYGKQTSESTGISAVGTSSYTVGGSNAQANGTGKDYVAWNFKASPGFFDIVTWTGDSVSGRTIAHNLGSAPGMILVKRLNDPDDWVVYHRSLGATHPAVFNTDAGAEPITNRFNDTEPTSSEFTVGNASGTNTTGKTYIAYLFAHDDQSFGTGADESIIKCGSYTGSGNNPTTVNLGFEPQWVLIKRTTSGTGWCIYDNIRGVISSNQGDMQLLADEALQESNENRINFTAQGFVLENDAAHTNHSGQSYIYMAIRRPNKPPTAGSEVFAIDTSDATSPSPPQFTSGFVTDFIIRKTMNGANNQVGSRLQGTNYMSTYNESGEGDASALRWDFSDGWSGASDSGNTNLFCYMFKRAPGFMDVVAYSGNGSPRTLNHNLAAVPELIISKTRNNSSYPFDVTHVSSASRAQLNGDAAFNDAFIYWNNGITNTSLSTTYSGANVNATGTNYIVYLFATLPGVSKVGSYTGTGNEIDVDCGFTTGARFVMIKRTNGSGDWYIWDTARGINGANERYFRLNEPEAEVTGTDYIDPLISGFKVTSSAPADINAIGGEYLFLAIA